MRPIDADALKNDFRQTFVDGEHVDVREVIERIETQALTIEPVVVSAKWIKGEHQDFFTIIDYAKCSRCEAWQNPEQATKFKFCPNCGAKIDADEPKEATT